MRGVRSEPGGRALAGAQGSAQDRRRGGGVGDGARTPWDEAFAREVEAKARSYRGLGRATGIGESSIRKWVSEQKWSRAGAVKLAIYLGLARDEDEFDALFELSETQRNRRTEQLFRLRRPDGLDTEARLAALWRGLGAGDCVAHLFVDRFPLELLELEPDSRSELIDASVRGARFCYLFPSDEFAARLDASLLSVVRLSAVMPRLEDLNGDAGGAGASTGGGERFRPLPCAPEAFVTPGRSYLLAVSGARLRGLEIRWGALGETEGVCVELDPRECLDLRRVMERSAIVAEESSPFEAMRAPLECAG